MDRSKIMLLGSTLLTLPLTAQENIKPNILVILCDDMGYGDLGCYGQKQIDTPNLDLMAQEGLRFTQAYCGSPVSAPSRNSLMTGQHCGHTEVRGNKEHWKGTIMYGNNKDYAIAGQHPYDTAHIVIPEIMKDNGYTTGMFGKWAAGYEGSISTPEKRGIDEYYGYICQFQAHLHYPNFLNRYSKSKGDKETIRVVLEENIKHPMYGEGYENRTQYAADLIHREAMSWISVQNNTQPFFGLLTYTLPHAELYQPNDSILKEYKKRFTEDKNFKGSEGSRYNPVTGVHAQFAGMITRLDAYVGEIVELLRSKGMDKNTLIIFTSDNGPHEEGGADPKFFNRDGKLRGVKRSMHEGGIRVPFIAYWPGKIAPNRISDHQLAFCDFMPTICEVAQIDNYEQRYRNSRADYTDYFDGISFAPTLLNNKEQHTHEHLYWEFSESNTMSVRKGEWKLIVEKGNSRLYNLLFDEHEDINLANIYPEKLNELIDIVYKEHVDSPHFTITMPKR